MCLNFHAALLLITDEISQNNLYLPTYVLPAQRL